jgi:hypothetical protein
MLGLRYAGGLAYLNLITMTVWVPRTRPHLRDLDVFVDGSAESVTSDDRDVGGFGLGECS